MTEISSFEKLRMLTAMHYVARCVHAAVDLGLADALGDEPMPVAALAAATDTHHDTLERMLRLLSTYGLFSVADGRVSHTEMSRLIRSAHPSSLREFVRMIALPVNRRAAETLEHSIRTGEAAMLQHVPQGVWSHYAAHPEDARIFDAAMEARARGMVGAVRAAYDFSRFRTIVDVGGGRGHLLTALLEDSPSSEGVVFDLPHVVAAAGNAAVHPRLRFQSGDFFSDPMPAADAYILMEVLHDWPDAQAERIVAAVRRAAPSGARLLVMEIVPREDPDPSWATILDIVMLAHFGGRQRTRAEYEAICGRHSFRVQREIATPSGLSIFEAW